MINFLIVLAAGLLILVIVYLGVRLGSAAFYRSKQNFLEWVHRSKIRKEE